MARIKVPFKGVTSQSNHADGECKNIVNLRPERGHYKPVTPRKVLRPMADDYDIVFVHRGNGYENWIGVMNGTGDWRDTTFVYSEINTISRVQVCIINQRVSSINQIGNTLSFVSKNDIHYALWSDSGYKYLGTIPESPHVKFDTAPMTSISKTYLSEYGDGVTPDNMFEATQGLINIAKDENKSKFSDAFLIRWAFRLYDGSTVKTSAPILVMPQDNYRSWGMATIAPRPFTELDSNAKLTIKLFTLQAQYDFSFLSDWDDVIKSVDFFTTNYIGLAGAGNVKNHFWQLTNADGDSNIYYPTGRRPGGYNDNPRGSGGERYVIDPSLREDWRMTPEEKVAAASNFYLYYSEESFSGQKSITFPNKQATVKEEFSNIINQEELKNDSFSHHYYGAKSSSVYNNRLRLQGLYTRYFKGFPASYFAWGSKYNGENTPTIVETRDIEAYVHIKTEWGEKVMRSVSVGDFIFMSAFISYPDPRASQIVIHTKGNGGNYYKKLIIPLTPHKYLNISYAINDELKPFVENIQEETTRTPFFDSALTPIFEQNKIKVSEVNNPFVFPNENTYQVGSGEILAESSIIMNVSDRNYGMYPVFVFTTDGVFTMSGQDTETVHASIQAPTYVEPPVSKVICPTPYGVVFITKRGLMQISNHGTEFLSQVLREDDEVLEIDMTGVEDNTLKYPTASFREDLKSIQNMVYNPYDDELIISIGKPYNYVYDYETKSFYLSTNVIEQLVQNTYPDVLYITDNNLIDISKQEGKSAQISIMTRPIQFETTDIKKLDRVFFRGLMYNVNNMAIAAYHSIDGVNYSPIKGFNFGSDANYKDFDLGLLARETYRQYLFLLSGTVDEETLVEYVEFEVDKNYSNDKMR